MAAWVDRNQLPPTLRVRHLSRAKLWPSDLLRILRPTPVGSSMPFTAEELEAIRTAMLFGALQPRSVALRLHLQSTAEAWSGETRLHLQVGQKEQARKALGCPQVFHRLMACPEALIRAGHTLAQVAPRVHIPRREGAWRMSHDRR